MSKRKTGWKDYNWAKHKKSRDDFFQKKLWKEKDCCSVCHGEKGGVKGNENIIEGNLMCDYCTVEFRKKEGGSPCGV
jgi:hypothetical protein